MSPLPRAVEAAGISALSRKRDPTSIEADDFFRDSDRVRTLFGRLVNAPADRIAIVPGVSYGAATVAKNLDLRAGQNIVLSAEQFPSNVYAWRRVAARAGVPVRTVAPPPASSRGEAWNAALLQAIDEATALVALPHVHWTDGTRFDLEAIGARAREVGACFVVDGTQSIGALPFDVQQVRPDALLCSGYKWLLGPYGISVAYYGERFDSGEPLEETWIGRRGSEDFRGLVDYRDEYQPGAVRYDAGERSSFILVPMLASALELVLEWRPERIQDYCRRLMAQPLAEAARLGYTVEHETWRAAHLVGIRFGGHDTTAIQQALAVANVHASLRGSAVRIAPHVYNDDDDAAALLAALTAAAETGALVRP
jgi:selenocysteine lyase/cysteine desulfurase